MDAFAPAGQQPQPSGEEEDADVEEGELAVSEADAAALLDTATAAGTSGSLLEVHMRDLAALVRARETRCTLPTALCADCDCNGLSAGRLCSSSARRSLTQQTHCAGVSGCLSAGALEAAAAPNATSFRRMNTPVPQAHDELAPSVDPLHPPAPAAVARKRRGRRGNRRR